MRAELVETHGRVFLQALPSAAKIIQILLHYPESASKNFIVYEKRWKSWCERIIRSTLKCINNQYQKIVEFYNYNNENKKVVIILKLINMKTMYKFKAVLIIILTNLLISTSICLKNSLLTIVTVVAQAKALILAYIG